MSSSDRRPLFLLPVYIGSFKYYEKLLPQLSERYDVRFLIVRGDDARRRGMLEYAHARGLSCAVIDAGLESGGLRFPFVSALIKHIRHVRACRKFAKTAQKGILVAVKAIAGFEPLFREANRYGLTTIVLQSALVPPRNFYAPDPPLLKIPILHRVYFFTLSILFTIADLIEGANPFVSSRPKKVGVIGPEGVRIFQDRFGLDPSTMTVVGTAEYQRISELRERVSDPEYRNSLLRKYSLSPGKRNILLLSSWYEHYVAVKPAHTEAEERDQVEYFERIIRAIRNVCGEDEARILFKMHPAEKNIYESFRRYGVHIYGDEALPEELLVLSHVYIADPCTSANYMVLASGIPAIFLNITPLKNLNKCTLFFPMERIITEWDSLHEALLQFKEGSLSLGYRTDSVDKYSIERIVSFISS